MRWVFSGSGELWDMYSSQALLGGPCVTFHFPGLHWLCGGQVSGWGCVHWLLCSSAVSSYRGPVQHGQIDEHRAQTAWKEEEGDGRRNLPSSAHTDCDT